MATPVNRLEIIIGYVLGLGVFALLQSAVVLLFTVYALQIHYQGSLALVFLIEVVLMLVAANLGILASAFAGNEFQAVQFIPIVIVPQALLSGAFWAIEEMPAWLQPLSRKRSDQPEPGDVRVGFHAQHGICRGCHREERPALLHSRRGRRSRNNHDHGKVL